MRYSALVFSQATRVAVTIGLIVAPGVPVEVMIVAGNHNGAKLPCKKRRSNQIFRALRLPTLAWLAIRLPTIIRVLILFHEVSQIRPPEPPLEIMANEASISKFWPAVGTRNWISPVGVKIPKTFVGAGLTKVSKVFMETGSVEYNRLPVTAIVPPLSQ